MIHRSRIRLAVMAGLACASMAGAQELDEKTLPDPKIQAGSCSEIVWQKDLLARFPTIADACQEVISVDGESFARFTGELMRVNGDGSVKINFRDRRGGSLGQPTLRPAASQRVQIDGKRHAFSELQRGQELNLYVPESGFAIATEPGAPLESMAQILPDEPSSPVAAQAEPVRVAQATPERLPDTASWTPVLALAGILTMLGGLVLTTRRRFRNPA